MKIHYKNKSLNINNLKKLSFFGKFIGLMFKNSKTKNLLFEFNSNTNISIHSFFVFFNFLALWLDENDRVIDFKIVKPFLPSIKPNKKFKKLIELPLNSDNKRIIDFFVGKRNI